MAYILECKNLTHTYGHGTPFERVAISDINLGIKAGEVLGLIGHTGSGKSTLIQHLNGLVQPGSGQILFEDKDIWKEKGFVRQVRFSVGLVFQYPEYQLFEETVGLDIAFGPKNMQLSPQAVDKAVTDAMAFVGLDPALREVSPFALSGGQKRRVAIAGVIAMGPKVLILDEPTAGLDPQGRDEILGHILSYQKQTGATVVLVTHSMDDIAKIASRIVVMNQGQIYLEGTPSEIFAKSDLLTGAGLDVPQVTRVFDILQKRGLVENHGVYTIEQGLALLKRLKEEKKC